VDASPARGVLDQPAEPGLRVTYSDDGFLLATKLIAQRAKDADDVVALADHLGLSTATPEQLEAHIRSYYTDPAPLELIVDGSDVDREISLLAHDASRMLHRTGLAAVVDVDPTRAGEDPGAERLRRSIESEKRTPRSPRDAPGRGPTRER
jgi:hypothetical protein